MPTKRLKGPVRTGEGNLTEDLRDWMIDESGDYELDWQQLTEVITMVGSQTHRERYPCGGLQEYRAAWKKHRVKIMGMMGKDPGFPAGTRPAAWWLFDAPEKRRQLSGPKPYVNTDVPSEPQA